ncbi:hypothetical protein ANMWB30_23250 [Arthrobacter sp. MWB30]|nr:hypothetical protein ANMWB30_23250 [Arthrobacter sp. MWB30]
MGFKDSARAFGARFKLDSHHAIERFGVLFGALTLSCVVIFGASGVSAFAHNQQALSSTALYTPTFKTSKTDIGGDVAGVFVSENHRRVMVLMQFDDMAQMSVNANDYQAFLTGSTMDLKEERLKSNVTGSVYAFASTGYLAVMLDSDTPFAAQVMNLTMRANAELVYKEDAGGSKKDDILADGSFQKYDQWRVFFNPGGSEATVSSALSGESVDVGAIFDETVVATKEKKIRDEMDAQLAVMQADLNRIKDASDELERTTVDNGTLRLKAPVVPAPIAGDEVTGTAKVGETPSTLALQTRTVLPKGYSFDWRSGSVKDGYLKDLVPEGSNFVSYLAERSKEPAADFRVNDLQFMLSDGTNLKKDYDSGKAATKPLFAVMNKLTQAYQDYFKNKETYQVDSYMKLLNLEVDLRNVESNFTLNDSDKVLLAY